MIRFVILAAIYLQACSAACQIKAVDGYAQGLSVDISKSVFTTPEYGLSWGKNYSWIPDISVGYTFGKSRLELSFKKYDTRYRTGYGQFKTNARRFELYGVNYERYLIGNKWLEVGAGAGVTVRNMYTYYYVAFNKITTPDGCWYEIVDGADPSLSVGIQANINNRFFLGARWYVDIDMSFAVYSNSYNLGRIGVGIGYRLTNSPKNTP